MEVIVIIVFCIGFAVGFAVCWFWRGKVETAVVEANKLSKEASAVIDTAKKL